MLLGIWVHIKEICFSELEAARGRSGLKGTYCKGSASVERNLQIGGEKTLGEGGETERERLSD